MKNFEAKLQMNRITKELHKQIHIKKLQSQNNILVNQRTSRNDSVTTPKSQESKDSPFFHRVMPPQGRKRGNTIGKGSNICNIELADNKNNKPATHY